MTLTIAALSNHGAWEIALIVGLVAALAVAALLGRADPNGPGHRPLGRGAARGGGQGRRQRRQHPPTSGHRAGAGKIVDEAVVQDGCMSALTDGFGEGAG